MNSGCLNPLRTRCYNVLKRFSYMIKALSRPVVIALIPVVLSILFLVIFYGLHLLLRLDKFPEIVIIPVRMSKQYVPELRARIFWGMSLLTLILAMLWNIAWSANILFAGFKRASRRKKLFLFPVLLLFPVGLALAVSIRSFGGGAGNYLINSIYENSSKSLPIQQIIGCANALACLSVFLIAASCFLLMYFPQNEHEKKW